MRTRLLIIFAVFAALLLVGGADAAYSAFTNRERLDMPCAELKNGPPRSAWIRLSGCRVLWSSIAFDERTSRSRLTRLLRPTSSRRITEVFYPLADSTDGMVRIVVSSDDAAVIDEITRLRNDPQASPLATWRVAQRLGGELESAPIEGLLRRRLYGSARPDAVKRMLVRKVPDFEILDLGATPSFLRAALLLGGSLVCGGLFLFVLRSGRERDAGALDQQQTYQPPTTGARLPGLMLLNLPADAPLAAIESAPPLGSRAAVSALVAELLPGAVFDESGRVTFTRADYAIEIDLGDGDPVPTAIVALTGQASVVAMRRLLRRTGWRIYAPKRGEFIAAEVLGSALAETGAAGAPEALYVPPAPQVTHERWSSSIDSARRYAKHVVGLAVLVVVATTMWWYSGRDQIAENEQLTVRELSAFATASLALRTMTGVYTSPEQLANPAHAAQLGAAALPPAFAARLRHGYVFQLRGVPFTESDRTAGGVFPLFEPAYRSFVYTAIPVDRGRTGRRSFALYSEQTAIYSRDDGAVPTPKDTRVPAGR